MIRYICFRFATFLSTTLPEWVLDRVVLHISGLLYRFDRRGRKATEENLRVILGPEATKARIRFESRRVFRNYGKYISEFFGYKRFGSRFIDTRLHAVGFEHVEEALARGKGAILATAHISNWELGAAVLVRRGYPLLAVAQMHPEPDVNRLFLRQRASRGYHVIPIEGAYRKCVEALKQNKIVCFVGDRNVGEGGVEVEFFGRPCMFPQGPARIALVTGAPLIPGLVVRRPYNAFLGIVEPPIPRPEGKNRREAARIMTQRFARVVEFYVRRFPAQWGVFFRMWTDDPVTPEEKAVVPRRVRKKVGGGARPSEKAQVSGGPS